MTNAEKHYNRMTQVSVSRLILRLGIPTSISMLISSIYNMADTYFVGTVGESAQAAVGIIFALQAVMQAIGFMFGHGGGTFISKYLANKDSRTASKYISTSFFSTGIIGLIICVFGLCFLTPLVYLLGSTPTILPHAKGYGMWILIACPFIMCSLVLNNGLRYEGKAFYAMFALTSGGLLNILGDYILVYRCKLGVYGAGMATAITQIFSFIFLFLLYSHMAQSKISVRYISRDVNDYLTICRVGLPSLIRQGLTALTSGILNNVTKVFGDAAVAAMSVVSRYSMFLMCLGLGIGQGFQPVAAFNYQAKEIRRVKKGLLFTIGFCFAVIGSVSVFSIFFAKPIITLFQSQQEVVAIGSTALRYCAVGLIFTGLSMPVNMLYQSIQQPRISSVLSMVRSGAVTIPVLLIFVPTLGITGVQIAQPTADIIAGFISIPFIIRFLKQPDTK